MSDGTLSRTYAIPGVLGVVSAFGLVIALLVDGILEWFSLAAIAAPLVVLVLALRKGLRV